MCEYDLGRLREVRFLIPRDHHELMQSRHCSQKVFELPETLGVYLVLHAPPQLGHMAGDPDVRLDPERFGLGQPSVGFTATAR